MSLLPTSCAPGLRVVIAGTIAAWHRAEQEHYYAGRGQPVLGAAARERVWCPSGSTPADDHLVPDFGSG